MKTPSIPPNNTNSKAHNKINMKEYLESNDDVIDKTNWTPLIGGGKSYKSHKLIVINEERLQFKMAFSAGSFYMYMFLVGFATMFLSIFGSALGFEGSGNMWIGFFIGLFFAGLGTFLWRKGSKYINLDKKACAMWKGKEDILKVISPSQLEGYTSLKKLHAVQIIKDYVVGTSPHHEDGVSIIANDFFSYEINLIMNDGKRVHVVDHGHLKSIKEQASAIGQLFDVVVWDACNLHDEQESSLLGSSSGFLQKIFQLIAEGKMLIFLVFFAVVAWGLYSQIQSSNEEEKYLSELSPQESLVLSQKSTQELLERMIDLNISLPYIDTLVKRGADIYTHDSMGRTPLFYAVKNKNFDFINYFIRAGADIHIKDIKGVELKDLLDPVEDKFLYYYLVDAELEEEAKSRGKSIVSIDRRFDSKGKMTYQKVNEQ